MPGKTSHEEAGELRSRLSALAESLGALRSVEGTAAERSWAEPLDRAGRLAETKLLVELTRGFAKPLVAVVAGGTNVGKSSLFNALLGQDVSSVDPRAGHTSIPVVAGGTGAREALAALLPDHMINEAQDGPDVRVAPGGSALTFKSLGEEPLGRALLFVDSPDVDSSVRVHHERAEDVLIAADVLLFVTSPTKYNDRRCVEFLLRASDMGKSAMVLFNMLPRKTRGPVGTTTVSGRRGPVGTTTVSGRRGQAGGTPRDDILNDFRRCVLERMPKGRRRPEIFEFEALPGDESGQADVGRRLRDQARQARKALESDGGRASEVKRAVAADGTRFLARSLAPALRALREQARSLEAVRGALDASGRRAEAEYERFVRGQEFIELELVLRRLLGRFRVPVLDDALDILTFVPRRLTGAVLRRASVEERRREQARAVRAKEIELVTRARIEFARSLEERGSDEVAGLLFRRIVTADYFARDLEAAWTAGADAREAVREAWLGGFEGELASKIERSPKLRATIRSLKALLELGAGLAAAMLTGGVGLADLLWAPAATKAAQMVLERLGRGYFRAKREEYVALARSTFADGLDEVLLDRLREQIPSSPATEDVDAVERELRWLARSFPATVGREKGGGG